MTIITFPISDVISERPHVRRFDLRSDLQGVADLVEQCFKDTLDADGWRYIRQLRSTAAQPQFLKWAARMAERSSYPFSGFVWDEEGSVLGNLSLIPMHTRGRKIFLIANVAVDPAHRRRGIAQKLTEAALEECRRRNADQIWLHVREDNPGALALYSRAGFKERTRRTSWYSTYEIPEPHVYPGIQIQKRDRAFWPLQKSWLRQLHAEDLNWYLPVDFNVLRPGFSGLIYRLLMSASPRQWAVTRAGQVCGVLSMLQSNAEADRLWLASPPQADADALHALLVHARRDLSNRKKLNLEYPAGQAIDVFENAGFKPHQTLIWMYRGG